MGARTVLLADDHPPTRLGTRMSLEDGGYAVCAEVGTADAAVQAAEQHRPDVALLDIRMPGGGIPAAEAIGRVAPATAVVMLTVSRDDDDLLAALGAGAAGYLLKDIEPERLPRALDSVLAGDTALPQSLVQRLIRRGNAPEQRRLLSLRQRRAVDLDPDEWEVLSLLGDGMTPAAIAGRLAMSHDDVRRHLVALVRKLEIREDPPRLRLIRGDG